jgi:hypothetical protein
MPNRPRQRFFSLMTRDREQNKSIPVQFKTILAKKSPQRSSEKVKKWPEYSVFWQRFVFYQ